MPKPSIESTQPDFTLHVTKEEAGLRIRVAQERYPNIIVTEEDETEDGKVVLSTIAPDYKVLKRFNKDKEIVALLISSGSRRGRPPSGG